jgi:2-oxoglutarate dehydrogenase complex dehydrogenase (E1) component-like enzyme
MKKNIQNLLEEGYVKSKTTQYKAEDWVTEEWQKIKKHNQKEAIISGIPIDRLKDIG